MRAEFWRMLKRWASSVRWLLALAAALAPASGCLDLGLIAGDEGDIAGGGKGVGGLSDGGKWPDGAVKGGTAGTGFGGSSGFGGGIGGAPACGGLEVNLDLINPYCGSCMDQSCCSELANCAANSECVAIVACATACPSTDSLCSQKCIAQHPGGVAPATPVVDCAGQHCRFDCARCGGIGSVISLGSTCDQCLANSCCQQSTACGHDPYCAGFSECFLKCAPTDQPCLDACNAKWNSGGTPAKAVGDCMNQQCGSANCKACGGLDVTFGKTADCGSCIEQHCCKAASDCANSGECVAYIKCFVACPATDATCEANCAAMYPNGKPLAITLSNCLAQVSPPCPC